MAAQDQKSVEQTKLSGYAVRELVGHKRRLCTLAWTATGRKLASGSVDNTIRIWPVEPHCNVSRVERSDVELKGHSGAVSHLCWKPGSETVLASTAGDKNDRAIRLWDVKSGKSTGSVTFNNTSASNLYISWSPDGHNIAAINSENTLSLIDVRKAKVFKTHRFSQEVYEIHWGPTLQHLMMATDKGSVDVVNVPSMDVIWSLKGHASTAYCFSTNKHYKYLASGGGDAIISLWDLDDMVCVRSWSHMDHPVRSLSLSYDNQFLAYATEQGELEVLAAQTGELLQDFKLKTQLSDGVAWSPTHNVLAYCDEGYDTAALRDHRSSRDALSMIGIIGIYAPPK